MSKGHPGGVEGHTHIGDDVIPPFGAGPEGATTEEEEEAPEFPEGRFGISNRSAGPGNTRPDRIDTEANVLQITSSTGVQSMPGEHLTSLQMMLQQAGLLSTEFKTYGALNDQTRAALLELKALSAGTGKSDLDTLRDVIEQRSQVEQMGGFDAAGGIGVTEPTGPVTTTSKTINEPLFTDPMTARAVLRDTLETRLGRAPTADEYHKFHTMLSAEEGGQDVSTSTTTRRPSGNSTTRNTQKDDTVDVAPADLAEDMAMRGKLGKEANTRKAGVGYYGVIANLVGGG